MRVWLRPGARFSDGSAVSVADVTRSLVASGLSATPDGPAILIRSARDSGPIELALAQSYVVRKTGERRLGSGPFVVAEEDAAHILLTRREPAPPLLSRVRIDAYAAPRDVLTHTLKGDADMMIEIEARSVEFFEGVPRFRILRAPSPYAYMIFFNRSRFSRSDRAALAAALSGDDVSSAAFGADCVRPSPAPESAPLGPGPALEVLTVPFFERFASAVRRSLGPRAGKFRNVELPEFVSDLQKGDFDLATARPRVRPPVWGVLGWRSGAPSNPINYSNRKLDEAIDARDWIGAQRILAEDPPGAILCTPLSEMVIDSRLKTPPYEYLFLESLPTWEVQQ
jgi:hypothetical protein